MDCLIVDCGPEVEVYVHQTNGIDYEMCGLRNSPCKTFAYAVGLADDDNGDVKILNDEINYTFTETLVFPSKTFSISGVGEVIDEVEKFPSILYLYNISSLFEINCSTCAEISYLNIYIEKSSDNGKYLFHEPDSVSEYSIEYKCVL